MSLRSTIVRELWNNSDPCRYSKPKYVDFGYPHTNLIRSVAEWVLLNTQAKLYVEIGSMLGGSAILAAGIIKQFGLDTTVLCIDPFIGDVNMWAWERDLALSSNWRFLKLEKGQPTIYKRFLANVAESGTGDIIVPLVTTSLVGIKVLERLIRERRLGSDFVPRALYLDSAHEPDETLMEIKAAWNFLSQGGVLYGDDWSWESVRTDVIKFAGSVIQDLTMQEKFLSSFPGATIISFVIVYSGQWLLFK